MTILVFTFAVCIAVLLLRFSLPKANRTSMGETVLEIAGQFIFAVIYIGLATAFLAMSLVAFWGIGPAQ